MFRVFSAPGALLVGFVAAGLLVCTSSAGAQLPLLPQLPQGNPAGNLQKAIEKLNQSLQLRQKGLGGLGGLQIAPRRPVNQGRMGVVLEKVDPVLVEQMDLARDQGLVVRDIRPDSAAARAGVKAHDILWEFNGQKVPPTVPEFHRLLDAVKADQVVDAVVLRKGKQEAIKGMKLPEAVVAQAPNQKFRIQPNVPPRVGNNKFNPPVPAKEGLDIQKASDGAFTTRYREEQVTYTLTGKDNNGKIEIDNVNIRDGNSVNNYGGIEQVPQEYRRVVEYLVRLTEKKE